ncbi:transglycosylase SLT domain-containing protein [Chromobacterium haemolyticum]|uniref:transglycosylase SLT domain-containing protein n=1 Tax=Chromobacterium haemolyticum TaxID=394935 RepID=UPI0020CADAB7|nr:transglycosylase SLT domain-containing protein [Chromobacterium haemolyticum]
MSKSNPYADTYQKVSSNYDFSPGLLARQGMAESGWRPDVLGPLLKGKRSGDQQAIGIAQILQSTGADFGYSREDLLNPEKAIEAQGKIMHHLKNKFGDEDKALIAYNWGQGNLAKHLEHNGGKVNLAKLPKETRNYLKKIKDVRPDPIASTEQAYKPLYGDSTRTDGQKTALEVQDAAYEAARFREFNTVDDKHTLSGIGDSILGSIRTNNAAWAYIENQELKGEKPYVRPDEAEDRTLRQVFSNSVDYDFAVNHFTGEEDIPVLQNLLSRRRDDAAKVARYGFMGELINIGASLTDPVNIGLAFVPGGALTKLAGFATTSRAAAMASGAVVGAATNIAADYAVSSQVGLDFNPTVSGIAGGLLGGAGGALAHHLDNSVAARARLQELETASGQLLDDATRRQLHAKGIETFPAEDRPMAAHNVMNPVYEASQKEFAKTYGVRFDRIGRLGKADDAGLRGYAAQLSYDQSWGHQGATIAEEQANGFKGFKALDYDLAQIIHKYHPEAMKDHEAVRRLGREAADAITDTSGLTYKNASPAVKEMAAAMRSELAAAHQAGNATGMFGDLLPPNKHYMPIRADVHAIERQIERFGGIERLIAVTAQWARKALPESYVKTRYQTAKEAFEKANPGKAYGKYEVHSGRIRDEIAKGWADVKIRTGYLTPESAAHGALRHPKADFLDHAIPFDRSTKITAEDGRAFDLWDLSDGDVYKMLANYGRSFAAEYSVRKVHGKSALEHLNDVRESANGSKLTAREREAWIREYEDGLTAAMGYNPHATDSTAIKLLNIVKNMQHAMLSGGFGINQAGEALGAVANLGWKAATQMFKGLEPVIKLAQSGDRQAILKLRAFRNMDIHDSMRRGVSDTLRDAEDLFAGNVPGWMKGANAANRFSRKAATWSNKLSGFEWIQRNTSEGLRTYIQDAFNDLAMGVGKDSSLKKFLDPKRLAKYGMDESKLSRIKSDIRKYQDKAGFYDTDRWMKHSPDSFADFRLMANRMAKEMIQLHHSNDLPTFMNHPVGQLLMQFQSFPMAAWTNATLPFLKEQDRVAYGKLLGTTIGSALVYTARMAYNSLSKDDPEEYREKYLSMEAIIAVGAARSSMASMIPSVTNTALSAVGVEVPGWSEARTTGNDLSLNPPTLQAIQRAISVTGAGVQSIFDPEFEWTKGHRQAARQLFIPNLMPVGLAFDKTYEAAAQYLE